MVKDFNPIQGTHVMFHPVWLQPQLLTNCNSGALPCLSHYLSPERHLYFCVFEHKGGFSVTKFPSQFQCCVTTDEVKDILIWQMLVVQWTCMMKEKRKEILRDKDRATLSNGLFKFHFPGDSAMANLPLYSQTVIKCSEMHIFHTGNTVTLKTPVHGFFLQYIITSNYILW